jgi:type I restriction enzyme S subunit
VTGEAKMETAQGPWELPEGWEWVPLSDVASGDSATTQPAEAPETMFPNLGLENVSEGQWSNVEYRQLAGGEIKSSCVRFDDSHVLYAKLRPYLNKVVMPDRDGVGSTEWVAIKPSAGSLLRNYLAWFLRSPSFLSYASRNVTGARMPRIRMEALWNALVPIPFLDDPPSSLETQRRIVARIEELLAEVKEARTLLEEMCRDAERMMDATLEEVFSELDQAGVIFEPLGSLLLDKPQYGTSQKAYETPPGTPILRMGNIIDGNLSLDDLKYVRLDPREEEKYLLNPGDILFNRTNSAELVGKSAVFESHKPAVFASYLIRLVVDPAAVIPKYVVAYINSQRGRAYIQSQLTRAIGQVNVNAKKIAAMLLPLPDLDTQEQIVAHLDAVQAEVDRMRGVLAEEERLLDRLERSILERAFRGEL